MHDLWISLITLIETDTYPVDNLWITFQVVMLWLGSNGLCMWLGWMLRGAVVVRARPDGESSLHVRFEQ